MQLPDDVRFLTGRGRYIDDERPDGVLFGVLVRSAVPHAGISSIDLGAVRDAPGVRCVLDAGDLDRLGVSPMRSRTPITGMDGAAMIEPERPVLARDTVRYVGEPIAFVVAETLDQALDAAELADIDYEERDAIVGPEAAVADGAPVLHGAAPGNVSYTWELGNADVVDAAVASAEHVFRLRAEHPRLSIAPVEPRGAVGFWDGGRFTLETPSQGVVMLRAAMSEMLGVEESAVRVITRDVGGSFAVKIWPYPEQALCLLAARETGRPVKWIASRSESFLVDAHGRGRVDDATLAVDGDGRITAFRIEALGDLGAYLNAVGPSIFAGGAVRVFGTCYKIPGLHYHSRACFTNAVPTDAYRGAGKPESTGTLERILDVAADALGLDRAEFRRRNLIQPADIPYATPMRETIDAGDFPAILEKTLAAADWDGFEARRSASAGRGLRRGMAVGMSMHASGGSTAERAEVRAMPDGTVRVRSGTQDSGQGHKRALARVAAESLGIDEGLIRVEQGDSDALAKGGGTGGSNLMPIAANTVHRAALVMIENGRQAASDTLEAAIQDIEYEAGVFTVAGTDRRISLLELAATLPMPEEPPLSPTDIDREPPPGCVGQADFEGIHTTWPNGAYVCEVEVDPETGHVTVVRYVTTDDLGRVVDADGARGQIIGGLTQAIGEVLMEGMVYDESGQVLSGSLMDYGLPRADQVPAFEMDWAPTKAPNSLIGVKGVGELSSIGGPGPVANAVLNALREDGVVHLDIPLTPGKIWQAINDKN